jgi:hypothetical protein
MKYSKISRGTEKATRRRAQPVLLSDWPITKSKIFGYLTARNLYQQFLSTIDTEITELETIGDIWASLSSLSFG